MRIRFLGTKNVARPVAGAALLAAELSTASMAWAGGAVGGPTTYPVVCRGPEGRAIANLNAPLKPGQSMISADALAGAVLHLTDRAEIRALEAKGLVVNTGHSNAALDEQVGMPAEFRTEHVSFLTESARVRHIGGGNTEYQAGATLAVESHRRSPVVLGMNEASRSLLPLLQIDVRTASLRDQSVALQLVVSDYRPEIRRCTRTRLEPNPWASLSPTVPPMIEVCADDRLETPETITPLHTTEMRFTACENFQF